MNKPIGYVLGGVIHGIGFGVMKNQTGGKGRGMSEQGDRALTPIAKLDPDNNYSGERVTTWFRDDCSCRVTSPDGDGCALYADFTNGLCAHCQGHVLRDGLDAAVVSAILFGLVDDETFDAVMAARLQDSPK